MASKRSRDKDTNARPSHNRRSYLKYMLKQARRLREENAFEPVSYTSNAISFEQSMQALSVSRRKTRVFILTFVVLVAAVALISLCIPYTSLNAAPSPQFYSPLEVISCWQRWLYIHVGALFDSNIASHADSLRKEFIAAHPAISYSAVIQRAAVTLVVIVCGCMLAVAGLLFQTSFKNPLATPSMLGVSEGVTLGCIIYALTGHYFITDDPQLYVLLVYGCGALALAVVFILSRLIAGGARYNIFDMLLVGTVITQLIGGVNNHISTFFMDDTAWEYFYELTQAYNALDLPITYLMVAVLALITIVPALLIRFRLNLLAFDDGEVRLLGARPNVLRGFALVVGSIMLLAAISSVGQIAMLSLAVPFLVRYLLPSEFRYQFIGNCLVGSFVLLICVALQPFLLVGPVSMPIGTVVGVLIVPLFVWIVALHARGWE